MPSLQVSAQKVLYPSYTSRVRDLCLYSIVKKRY